jgi:hypothetical protein
MRDGKFIDQVCNLFDVNVLHDIEIVTKYDEFNSGEPMVERVRGTVALGLRAEHSAGEVGFVMTNWFNSEDELDEFCEANISRFQIAAAECENGAPVPDATVWS